MPLTIRNARNAAIIAALGFTLGCASEQAKFSEANSSVSNEVQFGGEAEYAPEEPAVVSEEATRPAPQAEPAPAHPVTVATNADKSKDARRGPELNNRLKKMEAPADVGGDTDAFVDANKNDEMKQAPSESNAQNEGYEDHGINPMTDTGKDRFSTFSIDVDTGSYTIARRKLNEGHIPPMAAVRVEEFVNYFNYEYPNPDAGAFGVNLEAAPSPFSVEKDRYLVRIGVQGKHVSSRERKPVHLTFLVDTSGSMNTPDKLGLAKESLKVLTRNLKRGDTVSLATYAGSTRVVLPPTGVMQKRKIMRAIDDLASGGGTAMGSGMELAYKEAMKAHKPGHVNRVIVLSDGDANIGRTSYDQILGTIKSYVDEGITMSTIGFGMGNYKDTMMEQLANRGNGNYYYIDSIDEARKVFGEQIDGTLEVIAKDVKIQVEFNPDAVSQYRLIGYENRDIADRDFRNDAVDAGEIGAGHSVTALYEIVRVDDATDLLATVRIRHKDPEDERPTEYSYPLTRGNVYSQLADASKSFQFATAVATFAELLRNSPYAKHVSYELVTEIARGSAGKWADRQEFVELVSKATALHKRGY
jgi:Ca-activated chloride channel family protein